MSAGLNRETMAVRKFSGKAEASLSDHYAALATAVQEQPCLIVVYGPNDFLRLEAVQAFQQAWLDKKPNGDVAVFRASGEAKPLSYADILGEVSGNSLFASDKLLVIRQAERLLFPAAAAKQDDAGKESAASKSAPQREQGFLNYIENPAPSSWLLVETAQLPQNRTLGKKIAAAFFPIPCPYAVARDLPGWLRDRAKADGKRLDPEAAELLLLAHGADLGALAAELEKLSLYVGDGQAIDAAAVRAFMTGSVEFDIFGLTNAVEERDPAKALGFARKITVLGSRDQKGKKEDGEKSAHKALAMLAGMVQNLLKARLARQAGKTGAELAAEEKLTVWRADRLMRSSANFTLRELRGMAGSAADHIKKAHDTGGDACLAVELLAVSLANGRY